MSDYCRFFGCLYSAHQSTSWPQRMLSVLGKNVYHHHKFPRLRIFSPIREVYGGAYSYRHAELSFLSDLDKKNQTTDHCSMKPNEVSLGMLMLKNRSFLECYAVSTEDTAVTVYQSTRRNLYQHLRIPHLTGSVFLCAPPFYSAASITLEVIWTWWLSVVKRHKGVKTKSHMLLRIVTPVRSAVCEHRTVVQLYRVARSCR